MPDWYAESSVPSRRYPFFPSRVTKNVSSLLWMKYNFLLRSDLTHRSAARSSRLKLPSCAVPLRRIPLTAPPLFGTRNTDPKHRLPLPSQRANRGRISYARPTAPSVPEIAAFENASETVQKPTPNQRRKKADVEACESLPLV